MDQLPDHYLMAWLTHATTVIMMNDMDATKQESLEALLKELHKDALDAKNNGNLADPESHYALALLRQFGLES